MERALESIEKVTQVKSDDTITAEIVPVFRKLLFIEEEASRGVRYSIHLLSNMKKPREICGELTDTSEILYLDLPFCGTIKVERMTISNTTTTGVPDLGETARIATMPLGPQYPSTAARCITTYPAIQVQDGLRAVATEIHHSEKNQSSSINMDTNSSSIFDLQAMPCTTNDEAQGSNSTQALLPLEIMGSFDERLNPATDPSFFECLFDME
jgi:hypothetical protein